MALVRDTLWSGAAAMTLSGGRFLLTIFLAKSLGVGEYGKYVYIQWIVDTVCLVCSFGLPGIASRFFAEFRSTNTSLLIEFNDWFYRRTCILVVAVVIIAFITLSLFDKSNLNTKALFSCLAGCTVLWSLIGSRATALQQFKKIAISNVLYIVAITIGCIFMYSKSNKSINSVVIVIIIATIIASMVMWTPCVTKVIKTKSLYKLSSKLNYYGLNIWLTSLVGAVVWSRGEIAIIKSQLNISDLAFYSAAISLTGIATQGLMLLTGALAPHITNLWTTGNAKQAIKLCRQVTDLLSLLSALIVLFLISYSFEIVSLAFGSAYENSSKILAISSFGALGLASAAAVNQLLLIKTNGKFNLVANLTGTIVLIGIGFPLVKFFGIYGAAFIRIIVQNGIGFSALIFSLILISKDAVSLRNQAGVYTILIGFLLLILLKEYSFFLRSIFFAVSSGALMLWCRDEDDILVINKIFKFIIKKIV